MRPLGGAHSHRWKFLTGNGLLAVDARIQLSLFPHRKDSFLFLVGTNYADGGELSISSNGAKLAPVAVCRPAHAKLTNVFRTG